MAAERILLVEDNPVNQRLVAVTLGPFSYTVDIASDAEQALHKVEECLPDLILMDIQLPGMNGLDLSRLLKTNPRSRSVPIVAMTSYAMTGDEQRALDAGCDGYLSKPIDTRTLADRLAHYLSRAAGSTIREEGDR